MDEKFLFSHVLSGITMTIFSTNLEGAKAILKKLVLRVQDWENYK